MIAGYVFLSLFAAAHIIGRNEHHDRAKPISLSRQCHCLQASLLSSYHPIDLQEACEEQSAPTSKRIRGGRNGTTALLVLPSGLLASSPPPTDHDFIGGSTGPPSFPPVLVGDKQGRVRVLRLDWNRTANGSATATVVSALKGAGDPAPASSLPAFGLAVEEETATVFVGGGDRYVSVWRRQEEQTGCGGSESSVWGRTRAGSDRSRSPPLIVGAPTKAVDVKSRESTALDAAASKRGSVVPRAMAMNVAGVISKLFRSIRVRPRVQRARFQVICYA